MKLDKIKREVIRVLSKAGITDSHLEALLILSLVLGKNKEYIISHPELEIEDALLVKIEEIVSKRASGIPYAYLSKEKEFFGIKFLLDYGVLIPRAETETLVEVVLKEGPFSNGLDLFCGIGVIALSILYKDGCKVFTGIDISPISIRLAEENAKRLGLNNKTRFILRNIEDTLIEEMFDLIVANPPYIPDKAWEWLPVEVKNEPKDALLGGRDGLNFYPIIASIVRKNLLDGGLFAIEIGGENQVPKVKEIFKDFSTHIAYDLGGTPRVVWGRKE
ncbi:MAG: N5-glutamine methyltransferase family protein [bacterium]